MENNVREYGGSKILFKYCTPEQIEEYMDALRAFGVGPLFDFIRLTNLSYKYVMTPLHTDCKEYAITNVDTLRRAELWKH